MVKQLTKKIQVTVLLILTALLVAGGIPSYAFADTEPADISGKVAISGVDVDVRQGGITKPFIRDGQIIDDTITVQVGNSLTFKNYWSISPANMAGLNEGDYFEILLPSQYFNFVLSGSVEIYASGKHAANMELLTSAPQGPRLRVTLTAEGAAATELKDGWVTATGQASQSKESNTSITIGGITLPGFAIVPSEPSGGGTNTHGWDPAGPVLKNGYQNSSSNTMAWFINVNFDDYAQVYEGGQITQKTNVVITDTLEAGLVFNAVTFFSPYYYPHTDNSLSSSLAYCPALASGTFTEITESSDDTYESFYDKVIAASGPSYGIYQNKELVVSLKDFPDAMLMAYTWQEFADLAAGDLASGKLTQEQYDSFVNIYKSYFYKNQTTAQLVGLRIGLSTTAYGEDRAISNDAYMAWDNNEESSSSTNVQFQSIAGGANMGIPGSVVIRKFDFATQTNLDGAKFKLQRMDGSGTFVDYTPRDSIVERETIDGEIIFEELHYGTYRVVETFTPPGYQNRITFKDDIDTFTIDGTEAGAIFIVAYNYPLVPQSNDELDPPTLDPPTSKNLLPQTSDSALGAFVVASLCFIGCACVMIARRIARKA